MATTSTSPSTVARAILDAFNAHDVDAMTEHYADELNEQLPDALLRSPDELADYMRGLFAAVPDLHMEVSSIAEDGEKVHVHWVMTGTHDGEFQGLKPTGKSVELDGSELMTIRDGKLVANVVVFDRMKFGQQLGMFPPDNSGAERAMKAAFNAGTALKARLAARRARR